MKATISLSGLLLAEILAIICGYFYGYNFKNSISIFFLFTAFLPVTAFLLFTTSFGVDDEGKLRRDTFGFKILSALRPKVLKEDKLYICPTFWGMVVLMAGLSILSILVAFMSYHLVSQFPLTVKIASPIILVLGYIFVAVGIVNKVDEKTSGNTLGPIIYPWLTSFFVSIPIVFWVSHDYPTFNYYVLLLNAFLFASAVPLLIYLPDLTAFGIRMVASGIRMVLRSPPVRYVIAFHNNTCPVVEISSEGKVPTPTPVLTEPESKEPGSP